MRDETVERIPRHPNYYSLNLRADKRFNFRESSLVCYLFLWNVLNRTNVNVTYWNRIKNREDYIYRWGFAYRRY